MKKHFLSYISVLLLALLFGCEKDTGTSGSSPVCFYLSPEPSTRATDTEFEKGDAIGVFAAARDDESVPAQLHPSGNFADNKKYIFDGEKFVPDGESNSIFITSYPIDYYAYYPYATVDNPLEFTFHVAADQESLTESDLMYASNTEGSGQNNIPLTFTHMLSKVIVPYDPESVEGDAMSATITKAYTGSIINLSTGEIKTMTDEGPQDIVMSKDTAASNTIFTAIFPEQTFSASSPFIVFNNSKEFKLSADRLFESGHVAELPFMGKILEYQFEAIPLEKNIASRGGEFELTVSSQKYYSVNGTTLPGTEENLDYSFSISADWISFDKSTHKVSVNENTDTNTGRTGVITLKQDESGKTATCTITQSAGEVTFGEWQVSISAEPSSLSAIGGTSILTYSAVRDVLTNGVVTSTEKATPTISGSATGFTRSGATVTAANNTSASSRSVTYTATHGGKSATCTITQSAGSKQYGSWSAWTVSVSANPTTIARTGGTSTITASATRTRTWTWNGVSGSGGTESEKGTPALSASGTGFSLSGTTLTAGNNTTTSSRSCTVTATHGGKTATCTVTQSAGEITYGAWTVTISANPTTIAAAGGTSTLTYSAMRNVLTNGTVTGTEKATPTISGSATGFTRSGTTVTAANNTSASSRSVTYTATHGGKSATCTVTQSAGSKQYGSWSAWTVSVSANPTTIARTGGTSTITASATRTRTWTWNGVSGSGGTESEKGTPALSASGSGFTLSGTTLTAGNNTTTSSRSCTVTATHAGKSATCTVTQSAGEITYGAWKVTITANPTTIAAAGGTSTLTYSAVRDVLTNGVVTSTEKATPTISGSGTGFTRSGATVTAANNTSASSRSVTYTATHGGKSATCTVTQSAGNMTTEYGSWTTSSLTVSASPNPVAASGGNSALSCKANQTRPKYTKWNGVVTKTDTESQSVAVTATWSKVSGTGSLSGSTVSFDNNTTTSVRSGVYRASSGGKTADVTVNQSAGSMTTDYGSWTTSSLTVSASPNPVAASGGNSALSCKANQTRPKYTKWNGITTNTTTESQTIAVSASWSKVSSSGSLSGSTVTFGNNTTASALSGVYRASSGGKTADVTVRQSAGSVSYTYTFTFSDGSTSTSWSSIAAGGDSKSYSIVSTRVVKWNGVQTGTENVSYSGSSNVSWASVSGFKITVGDNPNASARSGVVTFTQASSGKTIKVTLLQLKKNSVDIN